MSNCLCKKEESKLYTCAICDVSSMQPMSYVDRQMDCPLHEVVMFCGRTEFVCPSCDDAGWYSTAGGGGATQHINLKTGETRMDKNEKVVPGIP